jgi:hypothetical protein
MIDVLFGGVEQSPDGRSPALSSGTVDTNRRSGLAQGQGDAIKPGEVAGDAGRSRGLQRTRPRLAKRASSLPPRGAGRGL